MAHGYWEHVIALAGINAIVALGFYVTFLTGQLSAAHAAFMGIGGYAAGSLTMKAGVPFELAMVLGALVACGSAAILAGVLRSLSGMFLAIATLAFAEIVIVLLKNSRFFGASLGLSGVPLETSLWEIYLVLTAVLLFLARFEQTGFGLSFRAIRDDPKAAAAMGINVMQVRILAFALGGFICGLGGALQIHYLGVMEPDELGFYMTVALLLFVVVGGRDFLLGPVVGAVIFTVLPEVLRVTSRGRLAIFSVLLIVMVIARPEGLLRRPVFWKRKSSSANATTGAPLEDASSRQNGGTGE